MWQPLRYVHLARPLRKPRLHFYPLKRFLFCVDAGVMRNWGIFDTVTLQIYRIFLAANLRHGNNDLELHFPLY